MSEVVGRGWCEEGAEREGEEESRGLREEDPPTKRRESAEAAPAAAAEVGSEP